MRTYRVQICRALPIESEKFLLIYPALFQQRVIQYFHEFGSKIKFHRFKTLDLEIILLQMENIDGFDSIFDQSEWFEESMLVEEAACRAAGNATQ